MSPAFLVSKKGGSSRLVVDYRRLNSQTSKLGNPFPSVFDTFKNLGGSCVFSSLDMNSGYHQIPLDPLSMNLTSFVILNEQYEYTRLPFGLVNAPRVFQRIIQDLFIDLPFVNVFLDDILVHSKSVEEHDAHLYTVLGILKEVGASLNGKKSMFYQSRIEYLGIELSKDGMRPLVTEKLRLKNLTPANTKRKVRKLLGVINWFRNFIPNLSGTVAPLSDLLKCPGKLIWTDIHEAIVTQIVETVNKRPLLVHPNYEQPFRLQCDASSRGVGSVLFQEHGVIGYFSRKFNSAQENYPIMHQEGLGVILSLQHFRHLILGYEINVETDHSNLLYLRNSTN